MRKITLGLVIVSSLLLAGCSLDPSENARQEKEKNFQACVAMGTGYMFDGYYCKTKFEYCTQSCSEMTDRGLKNLNDSWGNIGGFPAEIMSTMNKCLDMCIAQ